jgi:hypothetical protein
MESMVFREKKYISAYPISNYENTRVVGVMPVEMG